MGNLDEVASVGIMSCIGDFLRQQQADANSIQTIIYLKCSSLREERLLVHFNLFNAHAAIAAFLAYYAVLLARASSKIRCTTFFSMLSERTKSMYT